MTTETAGERTALDGRAAALRQLSTQQFDLVVVGGGITGAGIALDATTRGLRVALVERRDFAAGTSSRTTKLIHGGLRYLAQGQPRVTREASIERRMLLRLAPHLVHPLPFAIPLMGLRDRLLMTAALTGYDMLASFQNVRNHYHLSQRELLQWHPTLRGGGYSGGMVYYDGQTDDARLTVTVIKEAVRYGAVIANHCSAVGFVGDPVSRVTCRDELSGQTFEVQAHRVVLAAGVWVDQAIGQGTASHRPLVRPAKGVHLTMAREPFGARSALLLRHPRDGRYVFVIPWKDRTFIGTTDTTYTGDLDEPPVTGADVRYLLQVVNERMPGVKARESDILGVQAGLRPLVNAAADSPDALSREDRISVLPNGLVAIVGGKLTTYRHMAEKIVDRVSSLLVASGQLKSIPACRTTEVMLGGFPSGEEGELARVDALRRLKTTLPRDVAEHLLASYGAGASRIAALVADTSVLGEKLVSDLPIIKAEAVYAAQAEVALTLSDVLTRRLGLTLLDPKGAVQAAPDIATLLGKVFGWDDQQKAEQIAAYKEEAAHYTWG